MERLTTFWSGSAQERLENRQVGYAVSSFYARKQLLEHALTLTAQNPFLGVGPGMFMVAAAGLSRAEGQDESWHVTHNMYLQVTSECGVPAFLLFIGLILYCFRTANAVRRRAASHPELEWVSTMCLSLYMGVAVYCVLGLSSSIAYGTLLPVFVALTEALNRTSQQYLAAPLVPTTSEEVDSAGAELGIADRLRRRLLVGVRPH
jgi:O-antigen ligase